MKIYQCLAATYFRGVFKEKKQKGETSEDRFVEGENSNNKLISLEIFLHTNKNWFTVKKCLSKIIHTNQPPCKSHKLSLSLSFNSNSYIYLFWFTEVCKQLAPLNTRHWGTRYILRTHVLDFRNKLNIIKQGTKFWYEVERGSANLSIFMIFVEQTLNNIHVSHTV